MRFPGTGKQSVRRSIISCVGLTLTPLLCCVASLNAETLQSSNPFLPPGYGKQEKAPPPPPPPVKGLISRELEFRGIVELNGVLEYSLFHKTEQKAYWLEENRSNNGILVRGFNRDSKTLTVSMNGRSERLTLMSPNETPLPVATSINISGGERNQPAGLPHGLEYPNNNPNNTNANNGDSRRVVPRRRVILPQN